ncbi:MAG: hypothetical protein JRJ73_14590, partial [Deltaproteobacteria bacterium]|nr:hypothetical protein [Deltaproteobacteria bacterium]
YYSIFTTKEAWEAVYRAHRKDLHVFNAFTNMDNGEIMTEYGFSGAACPFMGAFTTWIVNPEKPTARINEKTQYWFCVPNVEFNE